MNIIIEEIVVNPLIQIEETIEEITIEVSEMQMTGATGVDGKSAYQSALDGGFVGSELEFNTFLSEVDKLDNLSGINTGDETASTIINKIGDGSKINQSYLPSYVDDILEYDTVSLFPLVGELGKIYIVTTGVDINKQYRWTGSLYAQITNGLIASTNDVPEGVNGLYFKENRVLSTLLTGISLVTGGVISATDSILVALGKLQKQITDNDSNAVKNIIVNTTTGTLITGTTAETVLFSALIPANSFKNGGFFNIKMARIGKIGTAGNIRQRIKINTVNNFSTATFITDNLGGTTILNAVTVRSFSIDNGNLKGLVTAGGQLSNDFSNNTAAITSYTFDPTVDNYIFEVGTLGSVADSMFHSSFLLTN